MNVVVMAILVGVDRYSIREGRRHAIRARAPGARPPRAGSLAEGARPRVQPEERADRAGEVALARGLAVRLGLEPQLLLHVLQRLLPRRDDLRHLLRDLGSPRDDLAE